MTNTEIVVAILLAIGVAGVLVPIIPGTIVILGGLLLWAVDLSSTSAWVVFAIAAAVLALGAVVKFVVPSRRLKAAGVPRSTMVIAGVVGIAGFFIIPVIGLFLGFVLGLYAAERSRLGAEAAAPATKHALKAVGLSILIELTTALLAVATWGVGVLVTG